MKKKSKIITAASLAILTAAIASGVVITLNKSAQGDSLKIDAETEVINSGIRLTLLSAQGVDQSLTKTFKYTITPNTAQIVDVKVEVTYIDGSPCTGIIDTAVNEKQQTVTISCLQDFDKRIRVDVISKLDTKKKASVLLDYEKRLLSISQPDDTFAGLNYGYTDQDVGIDQEDCYYNLSHSTQFERTGHPVYSKFTIDKSFRYKVRLDPQYTMGGKLDVNFVHDNAGMIESCGTELTQQFLNLIYNKIQNYEDFPTAQEIWNMSEDHAWKIFLANYKGSDDECALCFEDDNVQYETINVETGVKTTTDVSSLSIWMPLNGVYRGFYTPIDDVSVGDKNIIF